MGPLQGIRVIELAGLGPAPFCAMMLADMGATVVRVDRASAQTDEPDPVDTLLRNRRSIALNLKSPAGIAALLRLIDGADALIEGFRPGVAERLGVGPAECMAANPKLVYGRMTGWGQTGPLAQAAGHDVNYIALTGVLDAIGRQGQPPTPPLNLLGDYAGGSMFLAMGLLAAIVQARASGQGQVVDAAMIDGVGALLTPFFGLHAAGLHDGPRGTNLLDSGAPFYDVYACADGQYISIAAIEKKFRAVLLERLRAAGADVAGLPDFDDRARWPELRARLAAVFAAQPRAHWCAALEGSDACFAPVLTTQATPLHPHHVKRNSFITVDGVVQPAPAPRFSATPNAPPAAHDDAFDAREWALAWGVDVDALQALD